MTAITEDKIWVLAMRARFRIQDIEFPHMILTAISTGSEEKIDWGKMGWTAAGTFAASACANTLNQVYEVANDAKMRRTMMRPLPLGRVTRSQALAFAGVMATASYVILSEKVNQISCQMSLTYSL